MACSEFHTYVRERRWKRFAEQRNDAPHVLLIVFKATSTLDYALPLLWKIKQDRPDANVSVLYCVLNKKRILRKSRYYSQSLAEWGVKEWEFSDFLPRRYFCTKAAWKWLFRASDWDSSHDGILRRLPLAGKASQLLSRAEGRILRQVMYENALRFLSPDVVLFENRLRTPFPNRKYVYRFLHQTQRKVILLPHAPHHAWRTVFTPFDDKGLALPDYAEYWMPFKFERTWEALPEQRSQFAYVGYPGLDSQWLDQIGPAPARTTGPLRCLYVIRNFLSPGEVRTAETSRFRPDYEEFRRLTDTVARALDQAGDVELIVKPHPSNDFNELKRVFARTGIRNWRITHEPIYALTDKIDCVISLYSTVLFVPAMMGIPVILLNSKAQQVAHEWDRMAELYEGLRYYLDDPDELPDVFADLVGMIRNRPASPPWLADIEHLRSFYPDGAMATAMARLGLGEGDGSDGSEAANG